MTQTFNQKAQNIRDNTTNPNNSINESLIYDELILRSLTANSQNTDTILTEIKEYINGSLTNNIGGGADNPFWDVNGDYSDLKPYLNIITGLTVEQRNALGVIGTPSSQPANTNTDNTANMIAVQKGVLGFLNGESVIDRDGSLQNPFFDTNGDYGDVAPFLKVIAKQQQQANGGNMKFLNAASGDVSGLNIQRIVVNTDCQFTTLTESGAINYLTSSGIGGNILTKGIIITPSNGSFFTNITILSGSIVAYE